MQGHLRGARIRRQCKARCPMSSRTFPFERAMVQGSMDSPYTVLLNEAVQRTCRSSAVRQSFCGCDLRTGWSHAPAALAPCLPYRSADRLRQRPAGGVRGAGTAAQARGWRVSPFGTKGLRPTGRSWAQHAADGVLMDLGVSSPQIDDPQRGFSFSPRWSSGHAHGYHARPERRRSGWPRRITAQIAEVIRDYGEERFAGADCKGD
jgi:hypothetical protein